MPPSLATQRACPSCAAPMEGRRLARRPEGFIDLDLCLACQSIWFDAYESSQLTPGATIELFRLIHEHSAATPKPVSESAACPTCSRRLKLTHDLVGTNRFLYYRCPEWHGRFISFFHFLREKQFVRSLSNVEIERLKATVKQVRCSSCGGPVNVEKDAACGYCHAPLAILDADAVQKTLAELDAAERHRPTASNASAAAFDALLEGRRVEQRLRHVDVQPSYGFDLVREALGLLTVEL